MKNLFRVFSSKDPIVQLVFIGLIATVCMFLITLLAIPGHLAAALAGTYWYWLWVAVDVLFTWIWGQASRNLWKLTVASQDVADADAAKLS